MKRLTKIILVLIAALLISTGCETIQKGQSDWYYGVDPYKGPGP